MAFCVFTILVRGSKPVWDILKRLWPVLFQVTKQVMVLTLLIRSSINVDTNTNINTDTNAKADPKANSWQKDEMTSQDVTVVIGKLGHGQVAH